jgi:apolipoprotein N-acyltransferase
LRLPILIVPPAARAPAAVLRVVGRGSLVLLALYHVPLLLPALYHVLEYQPLTPVRLGQLLAALFLLPEAGARIVRHLCAATARVEAGALVTEQRGQRGEVPVAEIAAVTAWALPLPWPGLRLWSRSGEPLSPPLATADPSALLSALAAAGAAEPAREALSHPAVRYASARERARGRLDRPLLKFVVFSLVPAVPLFRLRQWVSYGGSFGEYPAFGLKAYLLGFDLLAARGDYLLLFAAALRALARRSRCSRSGCSPMGPGRRCRICTARSTTSRRPCGPRLVLQ